MLLRLDMARNIHYEDAEKQKAQDAVDFEGMAAELRLTEECAARLDAPVVWSHNDLLSGNVLVALKVSQASYSCCVKEQVIGLPTNPAGMPLYRSLGCVERLEQCLACNSLTLSTARARRAALTGAITSMSMLGLSASTRGTLTTPACPTLCAPTWRRERRTSRCASGRLLLHAYRCGDTGHPSACNPQTDEEVEAGVAEANFFALVSHQYWGVWAVIQACYSPIDFDYFNYSKLRWGEYHRRKQEFMDAVQPFLNK